MSNKYDVNINDLYAGTTPAETKTEVKTTTTKKVASNDPKKANGKNRKDNYTITFKIDADVEDYLKHIEWIKILETRENTNKNKYVNDLIRQDMIKLLKLKSNASYEDIQQAWDEYKKANNI